MLVKSIALFCDMEGMDAYHSDILLRQGNQKSTYPQLGSWALLGKCLQANTMNRAHIPRRHIKF